MIEGNQMDLNEVQEWLESGKDTRDAACGLIFKAVSLSPSDTATDLYLGAAMTLAMLNMAEQFEALRWVLSKNLEGLRWDLSKNG